MLVREKIKFYLLERNLNCNEEIIEDIMRLRKLNGRLNSCNTERCNCEEIGHFENNWTRWWGWLEGKFKKAETKVKRICEKHGWAYRIQTDPRGSAIKLNLLGDKKDVENFGCHTDILYL